MAASQPEVVCAEKDLGVYITDNLTWISKSMSNALRPEGSWDMYGETLDSRQKH